ncbi:hypothetical protein B5808_12195 [Cnuibacter physcomitrellae]|uniref:HTH gntR-type domain-containing protein n=1 Tax=Cnuibacter physcomitrellae TaxID=1619308 RepID=A0A1X9LV36_9MICO|nr:hypothetical protein B5808_12195 [Cnuibacter physcomitrellae]
MAAAGRTRSVRPPSTAQRRTALIGILSSGGRVGCSGRHASVAHTGGDAAGPSGGRATVRPVYNDPVPRSLRACFEGGCSVNTSRARLLELWRAAAEAGTPLPSEATLAAELGVSRPTVREELIRLESHGMLTRLPSAGTFPNRFALDMGLRLDQSYEFSDMLREAGYEPSMEVLSAGWGELDAVRAARLDVRPGTAAFVTVKRWSANGQPVMVAVDHIPASPSRSPEPDASATVFELVRELRGSTVEWELSFVEARLAEDEERELLGLPDPSSVLQVTMTGISVLGVKLYLAEETHRQGVVPYGLIRTVPR